MLNRCRPRHWKASASPNIFIDSAGGPTGGLASAALRAFSMFWKAISGRVALGFGCNFGLILFSPDDVR